MSTAIEINFKLSNALERLATMRLRRMDAAGEMLLVRLMLRELRLEDAEHQRMMDDGCLHEGHAGDTQPAQPVESS